MLLRGAPRPKLSHADRDREPHPSSSNLVPQLVATMAEEPAACRFTVKYDRPSADGEVLPDQQDLFNADCWAVVLLQHLKQRCGYGDMCEPVDLLKEDGTRVELDALGTSSAIEAIESRGTYVLGKLVSTDADAAPTAEMLWTPPEGWSPPAAAAGGKPKK